MLDWKSDTCCVVIFTMVTVKSQCLSGICQTPSLADSRGNGAFLEYNIN